jgi:hypothetical protein
VQRKAAWKKFGGRGDADEKNLPLGEEIGKFSQIVPYRSLLTPGLTKTVFIVKQ